MTSLTAVFLAAVALMSLSGVPGWIFPRLQAQRMATAMMVAGSALGILVLAGALGAPDAVSFSLPWLLPIGLFAIAIDGISAIFLAPVFIVPALSSIFGLSYWRHTEHSGSARKLGLSMGVLAGSMAMVAVACDGVLFLIVWEIMALAPFFAATAEDDDAAVRRAGWVYLVAAHLGTSCLVALFALMFQATGSFGASPIRPELATAIFVLAVVGFRPQGGHPATPRLAAGSPRECAEPRLRGALGCDAEDGHLWYRPHCLAGAGTFHVDRRLDAGGRRGHGGAGDRVRDRPERSQAAPRLQQHREHRNRDAGHRPRPPGTLAKPARLDRARPLWRAPARVESRPLQTAALLRRRRGPACGAHARHGAPGWPGQADAAHGGPLRRWFGVHLRASAAQRVRRRMAALPRMPRGDGARGRPRGALGAVALAITGALAVACFVKVVGVVFLGEPRHLEPEATRDPSLAMVAPMAVLAAGCLALGLLPWIAAPSLDEAARSWAGSSALPRIRDLAHLGWITTMGLALLASSLAVFVLVRRLLAHRRIPRVGTWDCGYARPTARMRYGASSFAQTIVRLFSWALWPHESLPQLRGVFPAPSRCHSAIPDAVLDRLGLPVFRLPPIISPGCAGSSRDASRSMSCTSCS